MEDDSEPELITADAVADAPPLYKTRNLKRLSGRRRLLAFLVILIGLGTFFAPTMTTEPPAFGHSHWSPLEVLTQIHAEAPNSPENLMLYYFEIYFAASYLLLLLALLNVTFFPSPGLLVAFASFGVLNCIFRSNSSSPFNAWTTLFGSGFHYGQHQLMLLIVNLLILGIVWIENAD